MRRYAACQKRLSGTLLGVLLSILCALPEAQAQKSLKEYWDKDYAFGFLYPAGWKLRHVAEAAAKREIRVMAQAPDGGSLMVVIEKLEKPTPKAAFDAPGDRTAAVKRMGQQTIDEIYRTISENLRADGMQIGEIRDVSSQAALKYYISTLHQTTTGPSIVVAGIHALPFGKAYRIDFMLTAPWNSAAKQENDAMMMAFNSFQLEGEVAAAGSEAGGLQPPDARK